MLHLEISESNSLRTKSRHTIQTTRQKRVNSSQTWRKVLWKAWSSMQFLLWSWLRSQLSLFSSISKTQSNSTCFPTKSLWTSISWWIPSSWLAPSLLPTISNRKQCDLFLPGNLKNIFRFSFFWTLNKYVEYLFFNHNIV